MTTQPIKTIVNLVIDRSGSMEPKWTEVVDGTRAFLAEQAAPGRSLAWLTLTVFDTEVNTPFVAWDVVDLAALPNSILNGYGPRGATALLDAVGASIHTMDHWLADNAHWFDGQVLMVIFTDGEENSSVGFSSEKVRELISAREAAGWTFSYFGANQDAWDGAQRIGVSTQGSTYSVPAGEDYMESMAVASGATTRYRGGKGYTVDPGDEPGDGGDSTGD